MIRIDMGEHFYDLKIELNGSARDLCKEWGFIAVELMGRMIDEEHSKEEVFKQFETVLDSSKRTVTMAKKVKEGDTDEFFKLLGKLVESHIKQ